MTTFLIIVAKSVHNIFSFQWSPDNPTVFGSAAEDGVLNIWDYEKVKKINKFSFNVFGA